MKIKKRDMIFTWTASTVSFQEDFASVFSFRPLRGDALARRLITPSLGPTWQKYLCFTQKYSCFTHQSNLTNVESISELLTWCLITTLLSSSCSFSLEPILMFSFSISPLARSTALEEEYSGRVFGRCHQHRNHKM